MNILKIDKLIIFKGLVIALLINYMIVTIVFHDVIFLKYLRDILVISLLLISLRKLRIKKVDNLWILAIYAVCVCMAIPKATSLSTGLTAARRYLFPVAIYYITYCFSEKRFIEKITKLLLTLLTFLSAFGIIQAYVLKDEFLKRLGYPQVFLPAYGEYMLNQAYYFGNFGIQRVVATMSSPNILALILGCIGIFFIINKEYLVKIKHWKLCIITISMGYLLTVSRSNFVALGIVGLIIIFPRLKYKERWVTGIIFIIAAIVIMGYVQGSNGIVYKLYNWVYNSLTFKESSAAGRTSRWINALKCVLVNPRGLGPGYVGSIASNAGKQDLYFDCENSYLCLALDVGWIGCISYYLFYIVTALKCKKNSYKYKRMDKELFSLNLSGTTLIIYFMIVMFFSNHIQDMEATSFLFMFLGMIQGYTVRRKRELCL